jgi:hypothetical protein
MIWRAAATVVANSLTVAVMLAAPQPASEAPAEIIERSVAMNEADWRAEPAYDHCERDDDGDTVRTYDVTIVDGTPYKRLIAVDDRPISPSKAAKELLTLEREQVERRGESPSARRSRLEKYRRTHARVLTLFRELGRAFTFSADGIKRVNATEAYVLNGSPRPDYDPPTVDTRALAGMRATFWVDVYTYQWVKITASVIRPVSLVGFQLVRVEPDTTIEIEKAPVDPAIWLTTHLRIKSVSRIFLFVSHHTFYDERDFDYRHTSAHVRSACEGRW